MATAMRHAVEAGRLAYGAGRIPGAPTPRLHARRGPADFRSPPDASGPQLGSPPPDWRLGEVEGRREVQLTTSIVPFIVAGWSVQR